MVADTTQSDSSRPTSPAPPGGVRSIIRRRAAKDQSAKEAAMRPAGTRAAGAGGSNATQLRLYTDDAPGLKVYVQFCDCLVLMR